MPLLILFFIVIPLIEIYFLIQVGGIIGGLPTVGLVVLTAVVGAFLIRIQGFTTLRRVQDQLARGQLPALELMEGLILVIAGALLLTPGFFTDTLGFLCLIPGLRRGVIRSLFQQGMLRVFGRQVRPAPGREPPGSPPRDGSPHRSQTIEGEYRREDD